jgi:hypothetical protein
VVFQFNNFDRCTGDLVLLIFSVQGVSAPIPGDLEGVCLNARHCLRRNAIP